MTTYAKINMVETLLRETRRANRKEFYGWSKELEDRLAGIILGEFGCYSKRDAYREAHTSLCVAALQF